MKSLERAVQLLEFLMPTTQEDWSISELADRTGLSLGTLHRMLVAWQGLGFVQQDRRTRRYRLGMKLMTLGMALWRGLDIRSIARPVMVRLSREVAQSVYLTVREGLFGVVIDLVEGPSPLRVIPAVGMHMSLHTGGSKKVLIAHLPEAEREEIISLLPMDRMTDNTVTDRDVLRADLNRIRELGYELTFSQALVGTAGVAVPVWGAEGKVVAGLMAAGPEAEFTGDRANPILEATVRAGQEISGLLGYRGPGAVSRRLGNR